MAEFTYSQRREVVDAAGTTNKIKRETRDIKDDTGKILDRLDSTDALLREVLEEVRDTAQQLTRRMDVLEQALIDPKSDAAEKLGLKYTSSKKKQIIP